MVNVKGAPKRRAGKEWSCTSIFVPDSFRPHWDAFCKLAETDQDPNFLEYCAQIEKLNMNTRERGRRGLYTRWLITSYVIDNQHKLKGEK